MMVLGKQKLSSPITAGSRLLLRHRVPYVVPNSMHQRQLQRVSRFQMAGVREPGIERTNLLEHLVIEMPDVLRTQRFYGLVWLHHNGQRWSVAIAVRVSLVSRWLSPARFRRQQMGQVRDE